MIIWLLPLLLLHLRHTIRGAADSEDAVVELPA